ncbi:MAG: protein kinase [Gemmatimonadaceae bacterium]|nr:protein kinase [Gemmatimonadaceae bacterium]
MTSPLRDQLQAALGAALVLQRELGGGGMSRVFLARDEALGREVVVKVLSPELAAGLSSERFTREIKLAASLQEPHIVPVLTAGTTADGLPWFTMPFVAGESLRERMTRGAIPMADALGILRNVAQALAYAHARGIVHRDIKPENVLLSSGTAVVADFGIAKAVSASRTQAPEATLTQAGMAIGTPAYMAPEQATGDINADHRVDLYAWGVLAYELLQGAHPFADRTTPAAMTAAHIATPAPAVTVSQVTPMVRTLVARCLAKDPNDRPARMDDVLAALSASNERTAEAPITPPSWKRLVPIAALFVAAAAAYGWWQTRSTAAPVAAAGTASTAPSLAVIPFASVGGDTANVYLADGIADELTTVLSRVPGLRLAGRSTAARFKGSTLTARQLGDTLGVRTILLGSLRRAGDRVRVTAELSDAGDGRVLWQNTFEEDARDVFKMQEQLAQAIAGQLQLRLSATATSAGTTNAEAYDYYLRGMQVYRNRGPVYADAARFFDEAIKRDSLFTRAWAGKALSVNGSPFFQLVHPRDAIPIAESAARRALALDSLSTEGHTALAAIAHARLDWDLAEREAQRAIALDSLNTIAHWQLGFRAANYGDIAAAKRAFERVRDLDPMFATGLVYLGLTEVLAGQREQGIRDAVRAHELTPSVLSGQGMLLLTLLAAGENARAAEYATRFAETTDDPMRLGLLVLAMRRGGKVALAAPIEKRVDALPDNVRGVWNSRFLARFARGDTAGALDALERASAGDGDLIYSNVLVSPLFDPMRTQPRFQAALARLHLENSPVRAGLTPRAR